MNEFVCKVPEGWHCNFWEDGSGLYLIIFAIVIVVLLIGVMVTIWLLDM